MVILVNSYCDGKTDLVLVTKETDVSDVLGIMADLNDETDNEWGLEDLIERLPEDCEVYNSYGVVTC